MNAYRMLPDSNSRLPDVFLFSICLDLYFTKSTVANVKGPGAKATLSVAESDKLFNVNRLYSAMAHRALDLY